MTKAVKDKEVPVTTMAASAPQAESSPQEKRRPLKTFTLGDAHASVWARDHEVKGRATRFYSVTFERSYRDRDGKNGYSRSFNPDDLGAVMSLCQQAGEYVNGLQDLAPATAED